MGASLQIDAAAQKSVSSLNTSFDISLLPDRTVLAQGGMAFPRSETGVEINSTKFMLFFLSLNPWKLYPVFFQPCSQEQEGGGSLSETAQTSLFQQQNIQVKQVPVSYGHTGRFFVFPYCHIH